MSNLPLTIPDLVCDLDLDPFAAETTSDLQTLIQDVTHVLRELPGNNPDDIDAGVGVETYLNGTVDAFKTLPSKIEHQLLRDDRITAATATIAQQGDGTFTLSIVLNVANGVLPLLYGWQGGVFTNLTK